MDLNVTSLAQKSSYEALSEVHNIVAIPSVLIAFLGMSVLYLVIGLFTVRQDRAKFMMIFFFTVLATFLLVVIPIILMPSSVQALADIFR